MPTARPGRWRATRRCLPCSTAAACVISEALAITARRCSVGRGGPRHRQGRQDPHRSGPASGERSDRRLPGRPAVRPCRCRPAVSRCWGGPFQPAPRPGHGADPARPSWPACLSHAPRLAPFLRHAPAGSRRGSALDPGTAGPRFAIDDPAGHADVDAAALLTSYSAAHPRAHYGGPSAIEQQERSVTRGHRRSLKSG